MEQTIATTETNQVTTIENLKNNLSLIQQQLQLLASQSKDAISSSETKIITAEDKEKYYHADFLVSIYSRKKPTDHWRINYADAKIPKDIFSIPQISICENISREAMLMYLETKCKSLMEKLAMKERTTENLRIFYKEYKTQETDANFDSVKIFNYIKSLDPESEKIKDPSVYKIIDVKIFSYNRESQRIKKYYSSTDINFMNINLQELENIGCEYRIKIRLT